MFKENTIKVKFPLTGSITQQALVMFDVFFLSLKILSNHDIVPYVYYSYTYLS